MNNTKRPKRISLTIWMRLSTMVLLGICLHVMVARQHTNSKQDGIFYLWRPWEDWMDTRMHHLPSNPNVTYADIKDDTEYPEWNPSSLKTLMESPTTHCRRLINLAGEFNCRDCKTCTLDGNKHICFDEDVRPVPGSCLIYSFGVGGDTSWDEAMVFHNCSVYAFDMTTAWDNTMIMKHFHFLNLQLHDENLDTKLNLTSGDNPEAKPVVRNVFMRSLATIRDILGHQDRTIDVLKLDVEFSEWRVLEDIFSSPGKPKVLENVKQIAMEIHLRDFKNASEAERVAGGVRTESLLRNLKNFGFQLAYSELNTVAQIYAEVRGLVLPLYRELLLLRRP